jgi:NitT/TauT family transport system substrate-binding protein
LKRSVFVSSVAATGAASALGLPAGAQAGTKILVGYWPITAALPFFVATKQGYFKAAGVDVELVKFADQVKVTEALLAGRINATATGTGSTQLAVAEIASPGLFKILGANLSNEKSILDEVIVAKGAPYKKISDLKGKKFATGVGPQAVVEAKQILVKNGITDVTPMELSPAQHVAAVASGQVDAAYTYEPNGTVGRVGGTIQILESGVRAKYLLGDGNASWYGGAAVIATDVLQKDPGAVKKYITGMKRGFELVRKNLNDARLAYLDYTSYDTKLVEAFPPILYTLYDEFNPKETGYFQDNYDLFFNEKILSRKLSVASMLYKA